MSENGGIIPVLKIQSQRSSLIKISYENISYFNMNFLTFEEKMFGSTLCCPVLCFIWVQSNQTSAWTLKRACPAVETVIFIHPQVVH